MRYAIIAAGEGSRLAQEGIGTPKPLVEIGGMMLIDRLLRIFIDNGASEVHLRLASPQVKFPCCYGVNADKGSDLPASKMSDAEICSMIGADSLGYISLESLKGSLDGIHCGQYSACFDGNFFAGRPDTAEENVHKVTYS